MGLGNSSGMDLSRNVGQGEYFFLEKSRTKK